MECRANVAEKETELLSEQLEESKKQLMEVCFLSLYIFEFYVCFFDKVLAFSLIVFIFDLLKLYQTC